MDRGTVVVAALAAAAGALGCGPRVIVRTRTIYVPVAAAAPASGPAGGFVFTSAREGRARLYRADAGGRVVVDLPLDGAEGHSPDVSPDGTRIAFVAYRGGGDGIYATDLDGATVAAVATGPGQRALPRWGPGGVLAFSYPAMGRDQAVWLVDGDGGEPRRVTRPGPDEADDGGHDFYDGGRMLVFVRYDRRTQDRDLWVARADGGGEAARITATPGVSEVLPVVSHDGCLLAYRAAHGAPEYAETVRVVAVGSWRLVRDVALHPPADRNISGLDFAADDRTLLVSVEARDVPGSEVGRKQEVFAIGVDGAGQVRLTRNDVSDTQPAALGAPPRGPPRCATLPAP